MDTQRAFFDALVDELTELTADPHRARRVTLAVCLACVITALEIFVAFAHWPRETPTESAIATTVVLERPRPTPRPTTAPTPRPAPTPTPQAIAHATLAPVDRAAPRAEHHAGGTSAAPHPVVHPLQPRVLAHTHGGGTTGVAVLPGAGNGSGAGTGSSADAGVGIGNGAGESGTGAVNADAPCGFVDLIPDESPKLVGTTSYETIRATVHFPDGRSESDTFPYKWVYADYASGDPWSPQNMRRHGEDVVFAQLPPPGADTHRYPDVIRYVLDHTDSRGHTVLQPCPR